MARHISIASSSSNSSGSRDLAIEGSSPSNLIDSKPDISVNGLGARITTSTAAEVSEQASSISWIEFECLPLNCWASSRTRSVFFESALAAIASLVEGVRPPNQDPAIDLGSESDWPFSHLTIHPSSIRYSAVETATVFWPSGLTTELAAPAIDQYHTVLEVPCTVPLEITASTTELCPGDAAILMAPSGFASYQWSDGTTTGNMLEVTTAGVYSLTAFNGEGCAGISNTVVVEVLDGSVAPVVSVEGDDFLCAGSTWTLTASDGFSYVWNNGSTEPSIEVGASGQYTVQVEDQCGNLVGSEPVEVVVFDGPTTPPATSPDTTLASPGSVVLTASADAGQALRWFDAEVGGILLAEGPTLSLPAVTASATYWVESSQSTVGPSGLGGEEATQPGGQYHTNSARWLEFDVFEPMRLVDVTLFANGTYDRGFEIIDDIGQVLWSTIATVTDGEFVLPIGVELEPGTSYGLRCTTGDPQLWREGTASTLTYPYDLAGLGSITNSTAGPSLSYYYFFYRWNVESTLDVECVSARADVDVVVTQCTDPAACNYNPAAVVDDGSCEYASCADTCEGDINSDGSITVSDLLLVLAEFGCVDGCDSDVDGDSAVSVADLLGLLAVFGAVC